MRAIGKRTDRVLKKEKKRGRERSILPTHTDTDIYTHHAPSYTATHIQKPIYTHIDTHTHTLT